ncbi:MAG: DUF559 domain-containing protein [Bacillota bacterium]
MLVKNRRAEVVPAKKGNMTKEQRHLWCDFLRSYSVPFKRNRVIGGNIADFYCPKAKLVVTLGDTDEERKAAECGSLSSLGLTELRFTSDEIRQNFVGVCEQIDRTVQEGK